MWVQSYWYFCCINPVFLCTGNSLNSGSLSSMVMIQSMQAPPDIQKALEGDDRWDFDILKLERISNKKWVHIIDFV